MICQECGNPPEKCIRQMNVLPRATYGKYIPSMIRAFGFRQPENGKVGNIFPKSIIERDFK